MKLIAVFAVGFALLFASEARNQPAGNALIPVSIAFGAIGLLATFTATTIARLEERIRVLEQGSKK